MAKEANVVRKMLENISEKEDVNIVKLVKLAGIIASLEAFFSALDRYSKSTEMEDLFF